MENDITKLNFVNSSYAVTPSYDLSGRDTHIKFYCTAENKLVIEGAVDNNYIYWFSVTDVQDKEINERIFNHIAAGKYSFVSTEYAVATAYGLSGLLKNSCHAYLKRRLVCENDYRKNPFKKEELSACGWSTPFDVYYGSDIKNHGRYFSCDIIRYTEKLKKQCAFKEAGGKYNALLEEYLTHISSIDYMKYDSDIKPVYEALLCESYLLISQNADTRRLYTACIDTCTGKYNLYMSAVR